MHTENCFFNIETERKIEGEVIEMVLKDIISIRNHIQERNSDAYDKKDTQKSQYLNQKLNELVNVYRDLRKSYEELGGDIAPYDSRFSEIFNLEKGKIKFAYMDLPK